MIRAAKMRAALVRDEWGQTHIIKDGSYSNMKDFLHDLRANGYKVIGSWMVK